MSAWTELQDALGGEELEAIVFGPWGWDGYLQPEPPPIPTEKQGILLSAIEAEPLMQSWHINGGFGAPCCYALHAWSKTRVFWITQYDGSTSLCEMYREPCTEMPSMPGG